MAVRFGLVDVGAPLAAPALLWSGPTKQVPGVVLMDGVFCLFGIFIDTNLLIYYVSDNLQKKEVVRDLLLSAKSISVSSQVISEFVAVSLKKINPLDETIRFAREFMELFEVSAVDATGILRSFDHADAQILFVG